MNSKGISFMNLLLFFLFLLATGVYFGGIYQPLVNLNIGDSIFFQILGTSFFVLAVLSLVNVNNGA